MKVEAFAGVIKEILLQYQECKNLRIQESANPYRYMRDWRRDPCHARTNSQPVTQMIPVIQSPLQVHPVCQ